MPIKHAFTSAKADGGDATLVRPSDWNADHEGSAEDVKSEREWVQGSDGALATGTNLPWTHFAGAALLDYTDPLVPTVIEAGLYAVMVTANGPPGITDETKKMFVGLDVIGGDIFVDEITSLVPIGAFAPLHCVSLTVYFEADDTLELIIGHNLAAPAAFGFNGWVQRISGPIA